jgi:hypothetical protein
VNAAPSYLKPLLQREIGSWIHYEVELIQIKDVIGIYAYDEMRLRGE